MEMSAPHVLIIGGFLTEPLNYRPLRRRLLSRGAARVTIAPIHLPDWALMGLVGLGPLTLRGARTIRESRREAPAPLLLVGHSMGGLIARLAMSPEPFEGRAFDVAADVGCLVTLGTPHRLRPRIPWRHPVVRAAAHLARVSDRVTGNPGPPIVTVGSRLVDPARRRPVRTPQALLARVLLGLVGETPGVRGDGLIGDDLSRLDGARHISLPDAIHGTLGSPWYGDDAVVDRWWPVALDTWRRSVWGGESDGDEAARVARRAEDDDDQAVGPVMPTRSISPPMAMPAQVGLDPSS
jgi:hypothetical protein